MICKCIHTLADRRSIGRDLDVKIGGIVSDIVKDGSLEQIVSMNVVDSRLKLHSMDKGRIVVDLKTAEIISRYPPLRCTGCNDTMTIKQAYRIDDDVTLIVHKCICKSGGDEREKVKGFFQKVCKIAVVEKNKVVGVLSRLVVGIDGSENEIRYGGYCKKSKTEIIFREAYSEKLIMYKLADLRAKVFDKPYYCKLPKGMEQQPVAAFDIHNGYVVTLWKSGHYTTLLSPSDCRNPLVTEGSWIMIKRIYPARYLLVSQSPDGSKTTFHYYDTVNNRIISTLDFNTGLRCNEMTHDIIKAKHTRHSIFYLMVRPPAGICMLKFTRLDMTKVVDNGSFVNWHSYMPSGGISQVALINNTRYDATMYYVSECKLKASRIEYKKMKAK